MQKELIHIQTLFKRLAIILLLFSLCRILFFSFNADLFPSVTLWEFVLIMVYGVRYDISAIIIINSLFILMHILPNPFRERRMYQFSLKILFYVVNGIFLILEASDFIYYEFAQERTSSHIFGLKNDILGLVPQFIKDFWYILIICLGVFLFIEWLYRKTHLRVRDIRINYGKQSILGLVVICLFFIGSRGGLQNNSLSPGSAAEYVEADEISLVTNTTFTVLHSLLNRNLLEPKYYDHDKLFEIFPIYHERGNYRPAREALRAEGKPNVMIFIMESFSKEYIGYFNDYTGYTPFLDSLIGESIVFTDAFANGKHSIDAIPSITLGLPALMTDAFISSNYAKNDFEGMGTLARKAGYNSYFFHGGTNGTMGFDIYANRAGFDNYYGRTEYNNEKDFDGNWGIFDEPFFKFAAKTLDQNDKPFCSVLFALSSHHPFTLPAQHKGKFRKGEIPMHVAVQYSDHALREFFKEASKMDWFENTIFIITSDHTGPIARDEYKNRVGHYAIPIVVYAPGKDVKGKINYTVQQTDILPTVLDLIGYDGKYTAFANGLFAEDQFRFSVNAMNNVYQILSNGYALHFDGDKTVGLYNYKIDPNLKHNLTGTGLTVEEKLETKVKAIIQAHRYSLIHNQLLVK